MNETQYESLDARGPTGAKQTRSACQPRAWNDLLLDAQRLLYVLRKILRYGIFPGAGWLPVPVYRRLTLAVRLRHCLEDLGLTYLKLGQFLALRFDILPAEICLELNRLFENVEPMPPQQARAIVETELGGPIERLYATFSIEPIAAASVAQVHDARLISGSRVAVKVQRAGLERIFCADIRNLGRLAAVVQFTGLSGRLSVTGMVTQFATWTLRELDFRIEGRTAERVRRDSGPAVVIPVVNWQLTTARVLTMEFIEGISAAKINRFCAESEPAALEAALPGFDLAVALHNFTFAALSQLFTTGFFHGDPHPGNILFLPDNQVAFLDFGIFGALDDHERENVAGQIENLATGNLAASFRYYAKQTVPSEDTDLEQFRVDCLDVLKQWCRALSNHGSSVEERHLARYTSEMINVSRRHALVYDLNYLLFWRAINNLNATLWQVKPDYDLIRELRDFFAEARPDPLQRALTAIMRPEWSRSVLDLTFWISRDTGMAKRATAQERLDVSVNLSQAPRTRRTQASQTRVAAWLLLAQSGAVLMADVPLAPGMRIAAIVILVTLVVAVCRWRA